MQFKGAQHNFLECLFCASLNLPEDALHFRKDGKNHFG
jgi:hypothetical protein